MIDPHDPRAGEKVAWNPRYRDRGVSKKRKGLQESIEGRQQIFREKSEEKRR